MKFLLLFTLGPVQSFIAQARKTHDLYAGSRLLSELIKTAIDTAGGEKQLIFPKIGAAMPNRFLIEVPEKETNLEAYGQKVERAVRAKWNQIAQVALTGFKKPVGFDEQIEQHLEIFWAIEPLGNKFEDTVKHLDKQVTAMKNIRSFSQYNWQNNAVGERGRKCSLDGQRNVQFYRSKVGQKLQAINSPLYSTEGGVCIKDDFKPDVLQPGEGLSAVGFVKRRYRPENTPEFESTAEIALLDALNFLQDKINNVVSSIRLHEYKNAFDNFNAQLFYEEGLSEQFLQKQGITCNRPLDELSTIRKIYLEDFARENGFRFQKYYAILTFDGDDMGKWLSGKYLIDTSKLREFQEKFADCLANFAQAAKKRLDNQSGQTVYAGGDDFLGFVNLNHILPVLRKLRQLFEAKVHLPLLPYMQENKRISFSAGICMAHYKEPLSLVLQEAKNAQKKAKELKTKDAFAISVIKGSGESHLTVLPFETGAKNVERLEKLIKALIEGGFSNSFISAMHREFARLLDFKGGLLLFEEMFRNELKRLLNRAANKSWSKETKSHNVEDATNELLELYGFQSTENFFHMLHIADFLKREMDEPKKSSKPEPQTT
ncbi:type III-B CRISPR-associated protein Cas10/Cmr2 [Haliscomenobacter sp.]|uniref:type III-B CRISPR-associated protein Cas10/Cmr2 n=1 Tax=Haliscomenobacter sp. TaxID=2717303 RepID=UPI003593D94A